MKKAFYRITYCIKAAIFYTFSSLGMSIGIGFSVGLMSALVSLIFKNLYHILTQSEFVNSEEFFSWVFGNVFFWVAVIVVTGNIIVFIGDLIYSLRKCCDYASVVVGEDISYSGGYVVDSDGDQEWSETGSCTRTPIKRCRICQKSFCQKSFL